MRFFLQRSSSPDGTVFIILDGLCDQLYKIKTVHPFPTCRLQVEGDKGIEAKIIRSPLQSVRAYSVSCCGSSPTLSFRIMLNGSDCTFYGVNWRTRGNIEAKNYDITNAQGEVIAAIASHGRIANAIELNVFNEEYSMACLCAAVCLNLTQTVDNLRVQPV